MYLCHNISMGRDNGVLGQYNTPFYYIDAKGIKVGGIACWVVFADKLQ